MPIKQKWFTKGLFTQNGFVFWQKDIILQLSYPSKYCMKDSKPTLSYSRILSHSKGNIFIIIIEDPCVVRAKP